MFSVNESVLPCNLGQAPCLYRWALRLVLNYIPRLANNETYAAVSPQMTPIPAFIFLFYYLLMKKKTQISVPTEW